MIAAAPGPGAAADLGCCTERRRSSQRRPENTSAAGAPQARSDPAIDLAGEHDAAIGNLIAARGVARLVELGISGKQMVAAGLVGLDHVEMLGDTYQPMPGGEPAYIVPVTEDGELIDLAAWSAAEPAHWATRLGVGFALGGDAIAHAAFWPSADPLELHPTPLAWVRAGCAGACVMRPGDAWRRLADIKAVVAANVEHGKAVARMLTPPPWPRPQVLVRRRIEAVA